MVITYYWSRVTTEELLPSVCWSFGRRLSVRELHQGWEDACVAFRERFSVWVGNLPRAPGAGRPEAVFALLRLLLIFSKADAALGASPWKKNKNVCFIEKILVHSSCTQVSFTSRSYDYSERVTTNAANNYVCYLQNYQLCYKSPANKLNKEIACCA